LAKLHTNIYTKCQHNRKNRGRLSDNSRSKYGKENIKNPFQKQLSVTEKQNVLPSVRYGFRQGKNTLHILTQLVTDVWWSFKSGQLIEAVFLDIEKGYDHSKYYMIYDYISAKQK
jgi:hypothetical protein